MPPPTLGTVWAPSLADSIPNPPVVWFGRDLEVITAKPFELPGLTRERLMRGVSFMRVVARLKPGVMIEQARTFATWARNIVVKIPVVNEYGESCLGVMHQLFQEGIGVNATAILSFNQALLAAKAGATYVSIFAGRVADEGNDPAVTIRNVRHWLDDWDLSSHIIVGSIRTVMDIQSAALAGAHIITIPPQFLPKMVDHRYTRETVHQFIQDAEKTMDQIKKGKATVAGSPAR